MNASEDFEAGMAEAEGEFNQVLTWQAKDYPCVASRIRRGSELMEGGQWGIYSASVELRRSLFATVPKQGQSVTFKAQTFYIGMVHENGNLPILRLELSNTPPPRV